MSVKELGKTLRKLREAKEVNGVKGVSLRDVEKETRITNAYVSLLERGEIAAPSAKKLHALAKYYNVPYTKLMQAAGYLVESKQEKGVAMPMPVEAYFMSENLDPTEWDQLADFHRQFIRSKKPAPDTEKK